MCIHTCARDLYSEFAFYLFYSFIFDSLFPLLRWELLCCIHSWDVCCVFKGSCGGALCQRLLGTDVCVCVCVCVCVRAERCPREAGQYGGPPHTAPSIYALTHTHTHTLSHTHTPHTHTHTHT